MSGLFTDAGSWEPSFGCPNRAPAPGEAVYFVQGAYTVVFPGGQNTLLAEMAPPATPPFVPFDVTFDLGGDFTTRVLVVVDQLRVRGVGTLEVTELLNLGGRLVVDGVEAGFGPLAGGGEMWVRNGGTMTTRVAAPDVVVDGGRWVHAGGAGDVGRITLRNAGRFEAGRLELGSQRIEAEGGSRVEVGEFRTLTDVTLRSGSVMVNRNAEAGFGDIVVDGVGSMWTVTDTLLLPAAARVVATNGGHCVLSTLVLSDPARFASLNVHGPGSRIQVGRPLTLFAGNAYVRDGGAFTVPEVEVGQGRQLVVGRGPQGLGGAQFDCAGDLTIGVAGVGGAGSVDVAGGGRAGARRVEIGHSTGASALNIRANGGTARFDVVERVLVGKDGEGRLRVSEGGRLEFTGGGGFVSVTPFTPFGDAGARGEVTVEGADSLLDLKDGALGVGILGAGQLMVLGGGRVQADSLDVGANADEVIVAGVGSLVSIAGASSSVRLVSGFRVWEGTVRVANGGFLQVTSEGISGEFTLIHPAVVDLGTGSAELGAGGPPPTGVLRVSRGRLNGSGTLVGNVEVISQGTCRPGSVESPVLRIEGSYLQDANGRLVTEVRGRGATEVDLIDVQRGVTLNGKLVVQFSGGFVPVAGDRFGIIRFGEGLTGAFTDIEVTGLAPGVRYEQRVLEDGVYGLEFLEAAAGSDCLSDPPRIERVEMTGGGAVSMTISVGSCGVARLEASSDLRRWRVVQELVPDAGGRVEVVDRGSLFLPGRFYRVVRH